MSEIKAGAVLNYISLFLRLGVSFFLSPYILACLGPSEYGVYAIAGSIIGWLALCDFGLTLSTTKFISEYQARGDNEGEAHYLGNVAALFSIIGLFVLVAGLCLFPFLADFFPKFTESELKLYRILYLLTLFNTAAMFPLRSLGGITAARQKYTVPGIVGTLISFVSAIGSVVVLYLGYRAIALCLLGVILGIFGMGWNVYYCFSVLKARMSWNGWDIPLCKSMFAFSFWMFLNQLINIFNTGASTFIIGMTQGAEQVSIYSYGLQLFNVFAMFSGCISGLFLPKVVHMVSRKCSAVELTSLMIRVGRYHVLILSSICVGIVLFGKEFFYLWLGKVLDGKTADCWLIAVIIIIPHWFVLLQCLGWQILQAYNLMKLRVIPLFFTSFMSLILGYYLSVNYGVVALAFGTACSVIIGPGVIVNCIYRKYIGIGICRFFSETLKRFWICLILQVLFGYMLNKVFSDVTWFFFFLKIVVFMVAYFVIMFGLYANKNERKEMLPFSK